jgi:predicted metal-dependent enzyme (double-stranded beta helix superfamily)
MSAVPEVERLAARIGAAIGLAPAAMASEIRSALQEATTRPDWLPAERRRASHENYARHVLHGDPAGRFSVLAIIWDPGQMSPIHGHYCWCAVGVYQGDLTENYYHEAVTGGAPVLVSSALRPAGTLSFDTAGSGIHRIANHSGAPAISLHVYGVGKGGIGNNVNRIYA